MSFVKFKREPQLVQTEKASLNAASNLSMKIDVVPVPTESSNEIDMQAKELQNKAIQSIMAKGKDLFAPNDTVVSQNGGQRLYQTADLYGQTLAIEDLIPMMTDANLTLRLNAQRLGTHAHSTCMELKSGILADLLQESVDSKREKTTELGIQANPSAGKMFVGVKLTNGKHYIQKVDYEVNTVEDDRLHLKH